METPGTNVRGWIHPKELAFLYAHARRMKSIVEIGSLFGKSSVALASGCKGPVWCIDPWDENYGDWDEDFLKEIRVTNGGLDYFLENTYDLENIRIIRGRSPEAGRFVPRHMIDMVFIDGDHTRQGFRKDLDYWLPRTSKLICGHDYGVSTPTGGGVDDVVRNVFGDNFYVIDTLWYSEIL